MIKDEFSFQIFYPAKNDMRFIYPDLRDRERTCIKEKVKSRDKYTCSEFPCNPVKKTGLNTNFKKVHTHARRRETSYDVARLLLMVPLEPWQNSTPFFGAAALCATKIDNFRTYLTTWSTHSSKRRSLRWTSFKRQIMEVIEVDQQLLREYNNWFSKMLAAGAYSTMSCLFFDNYFGQTAFCKFL